MFEFLSLKLSFTKNSKKSYQIIKYFKVPVRHNEVDRVQQQVDRTRQLLFISKLMFYVSYGMNISLKIMLYSIYDD